ncbi:MAG: 1,4-dihydroxy-2-naphthoate polyprenyltransferase [Pseudonocardiaceae bacterium]|nr:1,4-dihydroxy-2-naphthoate polyprenyltransferase [Pseudonocardiaceae bacterium]
MATVSQWVEGARPRTLPNAVAPVLAGIGAAAAVTDELPWSRAGLALLVALALVIGVNYANDYSDGVRGADVERVGPMRLVGSGAAAAGQVRTAALGCFGVAAAAGLALVAATGQWWLLAVGAVCIAGAWYYTGGARPYGYAGLGELAVFVFFGPVAVLGTQYVLSGRISGAGAGVAVAIGTLSAAVLVANNLRDIPSDTVADKRTLAVLIGDSRTRALYTTLLIVPVVTTCLLAFATPATLAALLFAPLAVPSMLRVLRGATGRDLIVVLRDTGLAMLLWAAATAAALALA